MEGMISTMIYLYIVGTSINVIMYPQYNSNKKNLKENAQLWPGSVVCACDPSCSGDGD
jgi:hypothetical protein